MKNVIVVVSLFLVGVASAQVPTPVIGQWYNWEEYGPCVLGWGPPECPANWEEIQALGISVGINAGTGTQALVVTFAYEDGNGRPLVQTQWVPIPFETNRIFIFDTGKINPPFAFTATNGVYGPDTPSTSGRNEIFYPDGATVLATSVIQNTDYGMGTGVLVSLAPHENDTATMGVLAVLVYENRKPESRFVARNLPPSPMWLATSRPVYEVQLYRIVTGGSSSLTISTSGQDSETSMSLSIGVDRHSKLVRQ